MSVRFRVPGSGFRVPADTRFWVPGSGFRVPDFGLRVQGSGVGFWVPGFGLQDPGETGYGVKRTSFVNQLAVMSSATCAGHALEAKMAPMTAKMALMTTCW